MTLGMHPFWQFIVKTIQGLGEECDLRVIISATYDLSTPISPVQFKDLEHVHASISEDEAMELLTMFARVWRYEGWHIYRQTLIDVSKLSDRSCHIGVVIGGIRMLDRCRKLPATDDFNETKALSSMRSAHFIERLDRAFRLPDDFDPSRGAFLDAVLANSPLIHKDDPALSPPTWWQIGDAWIESAVGVIGFPAMQEHSHKRKCLYIAINQVPLHHNSSLCDRESVSTSRLKVPSLIL